MRVLPMVLMLCVFVGRAAAEEKLSPVSPMDVPTQLAGLTSEEFTKLVENAQRSVVVITFAGRDGSRQGLGSGFIIRQDGLVATNLHVIGEGRPISVRLRDGTTHAVTEVVATDKTQDLAVVRIDADDLPCLDIAADEPLRQGQPVFALGNPQGLTHSVVAGVVSGFRDLEDGMALIQVAIPIEQGNSGGPLLDMQGRVHGLLTLKSQVTENLGYAVKAATLPGMIENPNPIPMSRWLTIGMLNPKQWEFSREVHWHQRSGRILVDGQAPGFGGRSLCLSTQEMPELPYELAVDVFVKEEDGAAGLVFHADGSDRHYGFYPSGDKLRLSRFDGPTVYSWHVLHEGKSAAFRSGEWNRLKVRVEAEAIHCFCNDELIFTSADTTLTQGRVGLAKFRHTTAEFKRFATAREIPSEKPTPEITTRTGALAATLSAVEPPTLELIDANRDLGKIGSDALRERARELEQRAARLKQLAREIHEAAVRERIRQALEAEPADLFRAALLLAALDNPDLDVAAYLGAMDQLAAEFREETDPDLSPADRLARLHEFFFEQRNYHGNRTTYYDYANSYLNEVIDDREGLPITLSVLYVELARRVGFEAEGVGLPGHFIARVRLDGEERLIDVFDRGRTLTVEECEKLVRDFNGFDWDARYLEAQSAPAILERMLRNLIRVANDKRDLEAALRYTRTVLAIRPDSADDRLFKAVICYSTGRTSEGLAEVEWLLDKRPPGILMPRVEQLREALLERAPTEPAMP